MSAPERVGILGGTFNPIHAGHLRAAEQVLGKLSLSRVIFVPAADPPLKRGGAEPIAPAALRLAWVEAAVCGHAAFSVDDLELERSGPSYTVDTLRVLRERLAPARPVFIVGEDAFAELEAWREPAALLALADFAVMTRPPGSGRRLRDLLPAALAAELDWAADGESGTHRTARTRVSRVAIDALDVSATEIRRRIRSGESVRYFLPDAVHDAVLASGAYGPAPDAVKGSMTPQQPSQSEASAARRAPDADQLARARVLAGAAHDRKAEEVIALDVRGLTSLADTFLIASGASDRQVRAIADAVAEAAQSAGMRALGVEGMKDGRWVLLDFGDAIFHVFQTDARSHYDLERLWADAPRLDVAPVQAQSGAAR